MSLISTSTYNYLKSGTSVINHYYMNIPWAFSAFNCAIATCALHFGVRHCMFAFYCLISRNNHHWNTLRKELEVKGHRGREINRKGREDIKCTYIHINKQAVCYVKIKCGCSCWTSIPRIAGQSKRQEERIEQLELLYMWWHAKDSRDASMFGNVTHVCAPLFSCFLCVRAFLLKWIVHVTWLAVGI